MFAVAHEIPITRSRPQTSSIAFSQLGWTAITMDKYLPTSSSCWKPASRSKAPGTSKLFWWEPWYLTRKSKWFDAIASLTAGKMDPYDDWKTFLTCTEWTCKDAALNTTNTSPTCIVAAVAGVSCSSTSASTSTATSSSWRGTGDHMYIWVSITHIATMHKNHKMYEDVRVHIFGINRCIPYI